MAVTVQAACRSLQSVRLFELSNRLGPWRLLLLLSMLPLLMGMNPLLLDSRERQPVSGHLEYLPEADQPLALASAVAAADSRWQRLERSGANFGYDRNAVWYRLSLHNDQPVARERLLVINYPLLDHIEFYQFSSTGELQQQYLTGDRQPHSSRPLSHRIFAFPLTLEPQSQAALYLRVQTSGSHQVPLQLWQPEAFHAASHMDGIGRGMFYGMLLLMVVFNLFLFYSLKERSYIFYVMSMTTLLFLMTGLHGVSFHYLYPDSPAVHEQVILTLSPLLLLFLCQFADQFLRLKKTLPGGHWLLQGLSLLALLLVLASLVLPYGLLTRLTAWLSVPVGFAMLGIGARVWHLGDPSGRYFITAWLALLVGGLLWIGRMMGFIPGSLVTEYAIEAGAVTQGVLLSFALGDRYNRERERRLKEQRARIEALRQRELAEQQVLNNARHHSLTGLPNRVMLESCLKQQLARVSRAGTGQLALLLVHFRGFDDINKTLGHENADQVLCQLAAEMNRQVLAMPDRVLVESTAEHNYVAAHVEGVTFACAFYAGSREMARGYVTSLVKALREPVAFQGLSLEVGMVGGCAIYPEDSADAATLLRHAFIAFDQASADVNHVAFYRPDTNPYSERRLTLMTALRQAITENTLTLYFQPQIRLNPLSVSGFEALLRWQHPHYGFIPPDEFIPMAEQTGLMGPITDWVLTHALGFARQLQQTHEGLQISMNISALNLQQPDFALQVAMRVAEQGLAPQSLLLEVTETATMVDPKASLKTLRELADAGIRLAIDDFGTGYSSLSYIRKLPVNEIKIDRSFVLDMDANRDDATIVRTTINMCHDLGFSVVAEGVETAASQDLLEAMGCDVLQGYHLGRPMPADQVAGWLKSFKAGSGGAGEG
ncbi:MAG: EAL domain-containing protein [Halomonadaceae bacterium]|nr:MAG: EAL domain-containing protein [Halomonadaceae bacterium]